MLKAYKYRLYPTASQKSKINQTFGCCRLVYNLALETKITAYNSSGTNLTAYDLINQLPDLKSEFKWLKEVDSQSLQAEIRKLDQAYKGFFNGKGFPNFKKKVGHQSYTCPNGTRKLDFNSNLLSIPKIKNIPIVVSRIFNGVIRNVTIKKTPSGKYFASVLVDDGKPLPIKRPTVSETSVGVDVGLKHFCVLSNGVKIDNPQLLINNIERLVCLQRRLSRKRKGSNNRRKAKLKVAILHERIANQRGDFLHKLSTAITKQYDTVCIESLQIGNMLKNGNLAKSISDAGWGEFFRQLKYKMDWKGGTILTLPDFYPSSKKCNHCGALNDALTLADREWKCSCGTSHDRDVNAAMNIKKFHFTAT